jgi:TPR repeat protein
LQAHTVLGFLSQAGSGGPVDHGAARRHFEQAAKADDGRAYYGLGLAYLHGHGVEKNPARAAEWFEKGSKQGVPLARVALAELLIHGNGIAKDDGRAVELLDQAVAALHPSAYQVRAWMHEQGRGGAKDAVAASRLYLLAAQAGLPFSQWQIGERLFAGTGIAQDRKAGRQWVEKAAAAGLAGAKERLAKLEQPVGGSDPSNAYAEAMTAYIDGRMKDLSQQADAARRRIDQLNRDQHKNVLDLRKLLADERKAVGLLLERVDNSQQMVVKIDELLALGSVAADELVSLQSKRSRALDQQVADRRRIADLMGRYPHALGWRLPDGRIVVARPDGHLVALGSDPPTKGVDTAALPRKGDQWVRGVNVNALVRYEESWTEVPNDDARIVRMVASLNELMGQYSCDRSAFGSINVSSRNTAKAGPPVVVDLNRVMRLREQGGDSKQDLWFEREEFIPLGKVGEVELQRTRAGATCATVFLRCDRARHQCVAVAGSEPEVSTGVAVSLSFTDDAKATRAAQLLEELIRLPR